MKEYNFQLKTFFILIIFLDDVKLLKYTFVHMVHDETKMILFQIQRSIKSKRFRPTEIMFVLEAKSIYILK